MNLLLLLLLLLVLCCCCCCCWCLCCLLSWLVACLLASLFVAWLVLVTTCQLFTPRVLRHALRLEKYPAQANSVIELREACTTASICWLGLRSSDRRDPPPWFCCPFCFSSTRCFLRKKCILSSSSSYVAIPQPLFCEVLVLFLVSRVATLVAD